MDITHYPALNLNQNITNNPMTPDLTLTFELRLPTLSKL